MSEDDVIWVMRDGRSIAVGDMTERHAKNVLRMLIRERAAIVDESSDREYPYADDYLWRTA